MNDVFLWAAHNTLIALVLALLVFAFTRLRRNPPVAHLLWVLVLLKLVTPPVLRVDGLPLTLVESAGAGAAPFDPALTDGPGPIASTTGRPGQASSSATFDMHSLGTMARPALLGIWLAGSFLWVALTALRIVRFEKLLRGTLPASERLLHTTRELSQKLGVSRVPDVRCAESVEIPLLWCLGRRPTIVLPINLLHAIDHEQAAMILAHELAHLRRRDHWVRAVEFAVSAVYWWNPLSWLVRRQIHEAEDQCCDAWVNWAFPDREQCYAEVVLKAAESLHNSRFARPLPASYFLRSQPLKARIEMILRSSFTPSISKTSMISIGLFALVIVPTWMHATSLEAAPGPAEKAGAVQSEEETLSLAGEFPYAVQFEQGATRFEAGDEITIEEVRGTADTFQPGNIYWIKGTYKLTSRDRAALSVYTTAQEAKDAWSTPLKVQTAHVERGSGSFTLFLPMLCRGWPHVSFYPAEGGSSFGGNYIGTGETVLKKWWGEKGNNEQRAETP